MNSKEIRAYVKDVTETGINNYPQFQQKIVRAEAVLLGEVAAHLSDLLEHFKAVDSAVFGSPTAPKKEVKDGK